MAIIQQRNSTEDLPAFMLQLLAAKEHQQLQKENLKLEQAKLKLGQEQAAAAAQERAQQQAGAWQSLAGAMQSLGNQGFMQAAPQVTQALGNANVTAPQLNAEIGAAVAPPNAQGQGQGALASAVQQQALGGFDQAKSVSDILKIAKQAGLGQYETDTAVNTFTKAQAEKTRLAAVQAAFDGIKDPKARFAAQQAYLAKNVLGLSGGELEDHLQRVGVAPTELERAQIAASRASADSSRASAAHAWQLVREIKDKRAAGLQAAKYLGLPDWAGDTAFALMKDAARPTTPAGQQAIASRALFGMLGRTDMFGSPAFGTEDAISRVQAGMKVLFGPEFKMSIDTPTQLKMDWAAKLPAAIAGYRSQGMKDPEIRDILLKGGLEGGLGMPDITNLVNDAFSKLAKQIQ